MKGVYILFFRITKGFSRRVGSLGLVHFDKGYYAYVGSAQSSLFPRIERHYAKKKPLHWHIDYLTTSDTVKIKTTTYSIVNSKEMECRLSEKISDLPFSKPIPRFGSSDCKHGCKSHLFKLNMPWKEVTAAIIQIYEEMPLRALSYLKSP